ncbi:MAG TPA: 4-(cytidine 5'-diphospho)-2-C-methyl-D-erythritol kinase [Syntrophales bacterium]|nr:4-(cytidine 5'-diphospho)-2-C-methyl-D-erythritol kinase [Syntrophales bacterium]
MRRLAPAKVNLHLKVLRRREDGYHDLATLMHRVSLCDELIFEKTSRGVSLRCPGSGLPEDEGNLVFRAAKKILDLLDPPFGLHITLVKKIPTAAGLGGGSSDAATTLLAVNEMTGNRLPQDRLMKMGAQLGADVPFFIGRGTAWAFGIGDRLEPLSDLPKLSFLLVNPRFELPTPLVYKGLNLALTNVPIHYSIPRFSTVQDVAAGLHNDLEAVSIRLHPVIGEIKDVLLHHGALGALMSGSGPTVFGLFADEEAAIEAERSLGGRYPWDVFRVSSYTEGR